MSLKAEQVFLAIQQSNNNLRDENCNYLRLEEDLAGQEQAENVYLFPQFFFCLREFSPLVVTSIF